MDVFTALIKNIQYIDQYFSKSWDKLKNFDVHSIIVEFIFLFFYLLCNLGTYQMTILDCLKTGNYVLCVLLPKPQTDNYITLQAFPRCLSVSIKSYIQSIVRAAVEISEGR